ncbi:acyltransferase [Methylobacterium sp. BTF04]|nr:acyltransferase [Methylobacterium sp. BTF04]
MQYRSIQALRAIAALLVVGHHLSDHRFVGGAAGVDVFFVISGFIMGTIDRKVSPGLFLAKRLIRIVPLYWATTLALCAGATAGLFARFTFDAPSLLKSLLFIPYVNATGNIWPLLIPGWTLNAEMLFYVLFAVSLWFKSPRFIASTAIVSIVFLGVVYSPESPPLHFWTMSTLLEFIAGLALAGLIRPVGLYCGLSLIAVAAAAFVAVEIGWHYSETLRPLAWGGPAALIVCGALAIERAGCWPKRALIPIEKIGDASYSLYLTHGFVVALLHRKLGVTILTGVLAVPLCVAIAIITYHGFEQPIGATLSRLVNRSKPRPEPLLFR